ncbi:MULTISPECIES: ParA family protein [Rhodomicrobium]|uniref:ParA family protein n=1 Tax=Rhodomicrobium TaxID=1068 RepID=UPI0014836F6A|nr:MULTISPECIES: ParA family protein [Rhodomicrobium]
MKVIAMASSKGGVGKSTLAAALAVHAANDGNTVLLIDLDPQQSTRAWWSRAGGPTNPQLVGGVPLTSEAQKRIERFDIRADYLIVDLPGSMVQVIEDAVNAADAIALVSQASPKDLEGQAALEGIVDKLGRRVAVLYVLNRVDKRSKLGMEAQMLLASRSTRLPVSITESVSYVRADTSGKTAPEIDKAAAEEIAVLWKALKGIANDSREAEPANRLVQEPGGRAEAAKPEGRRGVRSDRLAKQGT